MSLFTDIKTAKGRIDANYVRPSHFLARIDACKTGETRKGDGFMVIEMTVIEDLAPNEFDQGTYGHRAGESVSHMMMAKHASFLGNVKAFIKAVLQMDEDAIEPAHAEAICADDQPLQHTIIEVVARETETRAGNPFTVVNYKGEVSATDLIARWSAQDEGLDARAEKFFPGGLLAKLAEAEQQAAA